jgi:CRP/FNR family cyclic AMP-dependent transcriptional regulator
MARRQLGVALGGVCRMDGGELLAVDSGLGGAHPAVTLEARHGEHEVGIDEPVPGRHGGAVVEQRSIADHRRPTGGCADDDLEVRLRRPAEQRGELGNVVGGSGHRFIIPVASPGSATPVGKAAAVAQSVRRRRSYTWLVTGTGRPHGFLTGEEWRTLEAAGRPRHFRARQRLFREGEPGDRVIAVLGGRVKVSVQTRSGREILLAVKEPGDLVGELSAIDGRPRSATAIALEPVDALVVTAPAFVEFIEGHPRIAVRLLRTLAAQIRDADRRSVDRDTGDITCRVARRLVDLAERLGEHRGSGVEVTLVLGQDDLAAWVGATREATSRALGRLRAEGWLTTARQRIVLTDLPALRRRASDSA